jgi:hypothetical protein
VSRTRRKRPELTEDEIEKIEQIRVCYESTGLSQEQFLRLARIAVRKREPGRPPKGDLFRILFTVELQRQARLRGETLSDWAAIGIVANFLCEDKDSLRQRLIDKRDLADPTLEDVVRSWKLEERGVTITIGAWPSDALPPDLVLAMALLQQRRRILRAIRARWKL